MTSSWKRIEQGTDEFYVYRRTRRPFFELHGYRLNRCGWLWHVMLNDDFAGRKEHTNLDDAMAEAERLSVRELEREAKASPVRPRRNSRSRRRTLRVR